MDLVTHLPAIDYGHDMIYTVVNRLSKFPYFISCKHTVGAADFSLVVLSKHGCVSWDACFNCIMTRSLHHVSGIADSG